MTTWPILSVVTFLPLVGAFLIYISRGDDKAAQGNARWIALWTTLITFAVSLILVWRFDSAQGDFQFVEKAHYVSAQPPFGKELVIEVPLVETVPLAPRYDWVDVIVGFGSFTTAAAFVVQHLAGVLFEMGADDADLS